jgi:hypothetical protein
MGNEDGIDARKVANMQAWPPLPPQENQTGCEHRVNKQRHTAGLYQERGVPNERDCSFGWSGLWRLLEFSHQGLLVALTDKAPELT